MSRIGVIFSAYQTREYVERALAPWVNLRHSYGTLHNPKYRILICAVSVRFAGFEGEDDGTRDILRAALARGDIDHLIDSPNNIPETTARGMGLRWLQAREADISVQWDADEIATVEELSRMVGYVDSESYIDWFRIAYSNRVFTPDQYLIEPFTPPRVHRLRIGGYKAHSFSGDNDIQYGGTITRDIVPQTRFASKTIPTSVIHPRHYSWLNDARSERKCRYQWARWGSACSFLWDPLKGLVFNPALPVPKIARDA